MGTHPIFESDFDCLTDLEIEANSRMQANAEISHKVRLAIKTKLTELGAYVDDELPDYVLVMVANRRGRQDMKKELELFLGDATDRFCSWLFGVLDKLKDAKKTAKDGKRTSESETENQNPKTLDDYDEDEVVSKSSKSKKEEKKTDIGSKLEKIAAGHELTPEKSKSSDKSKKSLRKKSVSKSPSPPMRSSRNQKVDKKKRHHSNRSYTRSRSRSRSPRSRSRRDSKKDS